MKGLGGLVILILVALVFAAAFVIVQVSVPPPAGFPTIPASLGGVNGSTVALGSGFLGVNVQATTPLSSTGSFLLNATPVRLVRWPGGGLGDRFDPLANGDRGVTVNDTGNFTNAGASLAQFVAWCRSVPCKSIMTLPAEINDPATAAQIVNYTERTLGFWPTYWEIGNEPAYWKHYDTPWARWNTSQNLTPTPTQFANLVQQYVLAVRAIDSSTGIIGIGGIGPAMQSPWISATVAVNGPNLSAIAIHQYPAGHGFPPQDLVDWFATLWGQRGLPSHVPATVSTMTAACPGCRLALLVDEFQTGALLTPTSALSGGYLAAYVACEIVQALPLPIASLDYYTFQSGTLGAWFTNSGVSSASYFLYLGLSKYLGTYAAELNVTSAARGLVAAEGGGLTGPLQNVLVVNSNASFAFRFNLSSHYPNAAGGTAWIFNGWATGPVTRSIGSVGALNWTVPPTSLVIFNSLGVPRIFSSVETVVPGAGFTSLPAVHPPPASAGDTQPPFKVETRSTDALWPSEPRRVDLPDPAGANSD